MMKPSEFQTTIENQFDYICKVAIQWFRRILEKHKELDVLEVSDAYANKGTSKYFRVYVEVEEKE